MKKMAGAPDIHSIALLLLYSLDFAMQAFLNFARRQGGACAQRSGIVKCYEFKRGRAVAPMTAIGAEREMARTAVPDGRAENPGGRAAARIGGADIVYTNPHHPRCAGRPPKRTHPGR